VASCCPALSPGAAEHSVAAVVVVAVVAVVAAGVAPDVLAAEVAPAAEVVVEDATAATSGTCSPRFDLPADATPPAEPAGPADAAVSARPDGWVAPVPVAAARARSDAEHFAAQVLGPLDVQVVPDVPVDPDALPEHLDVARWTARSDAWVRSDVPEHSDEARCWVHRHAQVRLALAADSACSRRSTGSVHSDAAVRSPAPAHSALAARLDVPVHLPARVHFREQHWRAGQRVPLYLCRSVLPEHWDAWVRF